jgi:hypothetical protein
MDLELYNCKHCGAEDVLPMEGHLCPNCKHKLQDVEPSAVIDTAPSQSDILMSYEDVVLEASRSHKAYWGDLFVMQRTLHFLGYTTVDPELARERSDWIPIALFGLLGGLLHSLINKGKAPSRVRAKEIARSARKKYSPYSSEDWAAGGHTVFHVEINKDQITCFDLEEGDRLGIVARLKGQEAENTGGQAAGEPEGPGSEAPTAYYSFVFKVPNTDLQALGDWFREKK